MKALLLVALLSGCAAGPQLPPCPRPEIKVLLGTDGNAYIAFSPVEFKVLLDRFEQIREGVCRQTGKEDAS